MSALSLSIDAIRPLNRWDHDSIRPGAVGSVGGVNMQPRFKHSAPDLPIRWDPYFSGKREVPLGSNVSDGQTTGYSSGGGPARTIDSNWGGRRNFRTSHGWYYQDMRTPDKLVTSFLAATPDYSWHNKLAKNYEAKRTGNKFLPLPGGYQPSPGEVPRGGSEPRITDIVPQEGEIQTVMSTYPQAQTQPLAGYSKRRGISNMGHQQYQGLISHPRMK